LKAGQKYYVTKVSATSFKLSKTLDDKANGIYIDIEEDRIASQFRFKPLVETGTAGTENIVVDTATETIYFADAHGLLSGQRVGYFKVDDSGVIGGLTSGITTRSALPMHTT